MDVQSAAGLSNSDLGGKGHRNAVFVGQGTQDPLRHHELVGGILHVYRQEFDLILFVFGVAHAKVTYLGVPVLDPAPRLCNGHHGLGAQLFPLGEGGRNPCP